MPFSQAELFSLCHCSGGVILSGEHVSDLQLNLDNVTPELSFAITEGKIWLNEQRIVLFSQMALGKFRSEVYETLGLDRAKAFFLRLGFQLGKLDGELARKNTQIEPVEERFLMGPQLHALRGMVLPQLGALTIAPDGSDFLCEVQWHNSYEVEICKTELPDLDEPGCWTLVGYASGYSTHFLQRDIFFKEVECRACGHERCFAVGKFSEDWEDFEQLQEYYERDSLVQQLRSLEDRVEALKKGTDEDELEAITDIVGVSKPFKAALQMVTKASDSRVSVLLLGETGVGKEVMARTLHRFSDRAQKPFVAVNCAAIPADLIESELFGVAKGAFTGAVQSRAGKFERADGGTIFLDEVVELSPRAQATLLRVLQEQEFERLGDNTVRRVDVRVVAATNEDLGEAVGAGKFRADLYYRLSAYPIHIPSLRERSDDIPLFVDFFLNKYSTLYSKPLQGVSDRSMALMQAYSWPGNIRELENVIERAVILAEENSRINVDLILGPSLDQKPDEHRLNGRGSLVRAGEVKSVVCLDDLADFLIDNDLSLQDMEEGLIARAMQRSKGKVSKAARLLGMTRPAFAYRLQKSAGDSKSS